MDTSCHKDCALTDEIGAGKCSQRPARNTLPFRGGVPIRLLPDPTNLPK
jgi:hypothetical protein